MKYYFISILSLLILGIVAAGCSKLREDIPQAPSVSIHKEGIMNPASENFHGKLIRKNNWDMRDCRQCHAADYSGGIVDASCITCHSNPGGPEACNTCHGVLADPMRIAPPRDLSGNTSPTELTVGAHAQHLYDNMLGKKVFCEACHVVPQSIYDPGHVDTEPPAEVILGDLAVFNVASNAAYDPSTGTCSNIYCHGNFEYLKADADPINQFAYIEDKMIGNNFTVIWNKVDGSQMVCGSCHDLPPKGHIGHGQWSVETCYQCHQGVIDPQGNIIDKTKHINGIKNSRGN